LLMLKRSHGKKREREVMIEKQKLDWKKIYLTRHRVDNNWRKGKCRCITLDGHSEPVCELSLCGSLFVVLICMLSPCLMLRCNVTEFVVLVVFIVNVIVCTLMVVNGSVM
jgi:hypothetical protein